MSRKGSGIGFVVLLVALVIVMLLVAKAWKQAGPSAIEVSTPAGDFAVPDHGQTEAAQEVRSGGLPNLQDMREGTANHTRQVQDALQEIE